jgi:DNA-directed RNA polymerase specialized sigma24 family protein
VSDRSGKTSAATSHQLTISGLRHRCAEESDRFFRQQPYDPWYCFELFRRAILEQNERAWDMLYRQYRPLVTGWVERNATFSRFNEQPDFFVNRAFEKFWSAVTPEKFPDFPELKSLLRYLQMCVHSVIIDYARRAERARQLDEGDEERLETVMMGEVDPEAEALERVENAGLWRWIAERLNDDRERVLLYASFVLAMKPAEVLESYPQQFTDIREVYTTKENLMARLRRDGELQQRLQGQ